MVMAGEALRTLSAQLHKPRENSSPDWGEPQKQPPRACWEDYGSQGERSHLFRKELDFVLLVWVTPGGYLTAKDC